MAEPTMGARGRVEAPAFPSATRLPLYLTALIGREREVSEVSSLLRASRLVSLVGPGGSGKTRLAAAVGEEMEGLGTEVAWIDLTSLRNPESLPQHLASTLGLREHAETAPLDALAELFECCGSGRKRVDGVVCRSVADQAATLLLLDNCEHLVGACARVTDMLLRRCGGLRVLATSRQALGVPGERVWPVPPLGVPEDHDSAEESAAVRLFVERARDVVPAFALNHANAAAVTRICRRLDGLPLAIELAAARVRLLPPEQLAHRLETTFGLLASTSQVSLPRHRTLQALMDWSYALLAPEERVLLQRFAVFSGGFTLESAEAVAGFAPLEPGDVLDGLAALVDRSLVSVGEEQGEARYALLETVRQYAQERLAEAGDWDVVRGRHARHFLDLAEAAESHVLGGTRGTPRMRVLEREHGNLRAAMDWCAEADGGVEMGLRFGAALHWFHFAVSQFGESRTRLERALDVAGAAVSPRIRGRALASVGYMAFWMGDHGAVEPPLRSSVELLRAHGEPTDLAFALTGLGTIVGLGGGGDASSALFDEVETVLGEPASFTVDAFPRALLYAFASYWRGVVAQARGDLQAARAAFETAVGVARRFDSHPSIAHPLTALARVLILQGEGRDAAPCLQEAVPIHVALEDRWGLLQAVETGALLAAGAGRTESAARLLGAADRIRSEIGAAVAPHEAPGRARLVETLRDAMDRARFEQALGEGHGVAPQLLVAELAGTPEQSPPFATSPSARGSDPSEATGARVLGPDSTGLRALGIAPPEDAHLRVRALGPLEIFVEDAPLSGDAFVSGKPRELLLLLLCHRDGLTRDQVGLAFWPDASAAQVKNNFHVTLHRLRKALGRPGWILAAGDRYRVDPALRTDFDVHRFEEGLRFVLRDPPPDEQAADRLRAVLDLHRGEFLQGELAGDWHLEIRDRLRRGYVQGMLALGRFDMERGRFSAAADAFRAVVTADRLHEDAYRGLMVCLERTGSRTDALRLFETLRALLRSELSTEPAPATMVLYEQLRNTGDGTGRRAP